VLNHSMYNSVADPDPESVAFLTSGSQPHIFESLVTIFVVKNTIILSEFAQLSFFTSSKLK
jgi:hypothetical protein